MKTKKKVNVWQVGYNSKKDSYLRKNATCRKRGFVYVENSEGWEEEVWHLLNWSCWANKKPKEVHSELDHCNSDIILQMENTNVYKAAQFIGFKEYNSLSCAIQNIIQDCDLFVFPEVIRTIKNKMSGFHKVVKDKVYWASLDERELDDKDKNWIEVTW